MIFTASFALIFAKAPDLQGERERERKGNPLSQTRIEVFVREGERKRVEINSICCDLNIEKKSVRSVFRFIFLGGGGRRVLTKHLTYFPNYRHF